MTDMSIDHLHSGARKAPAQHAYALGYSYDELARLQRQGALLADLTEDLLRRAGLEPGMRVLDIGCGVGDVSLIAARLVGPGGAVVGVDRSAEAVATARRRAALGAPSARFLVTELEAFVPEERFDALIGRLILMHLPDPVATLRHLFRHLHPGAIIAFQELAGPLGRGIPEEPLFRRCVSWINETLDRVGADRDMGGRLFATFLAAGLPAPQMIAAGRVEGGPDSAVYDYVADTLRSLLPMAEAAGVTTAAEVDVATLAPRLRREAVEASACIMLPPLVGAWTRRPG